MSWFRRRRAAAGDESISQPDAATASPESVASSAPEEGSASAGAAVDAAPPAAENVAPPVAQSIAPPATENVAPASAPPASAPEDPEPEVKAEAPAGEPIALGPEGEVPKAEAGSPGGSELAALESAVSESAVPPTTTTAQPTDTPDSSPKGTAIVALEPAGAAAPTGVTGPVAPQGSTAAPAPTGNGGGSGGGIAVLDRPSTSGLSAATRSGRSGRRIGEVVVDLGFADRQAVEQAVSAARSQRKPTGQVLVEQGVLRQDQLARVVAERFGLDYIDLSVYEPDMGAVNLLSAEAIKRYQAVPVSFTEDGALLLAMADPTNILSIDDIAMITNRRVRVAAASAEDVNLLAARLGRLEGAIEDIVEDDERESLETALSEQADQDAPVIKLVHSIIAQAVQQGASDIHVNPEEGDTQVLFRVDGVLYPAATVRRRMAAGMVSRIKIMADLDISERRAPQDGRLALNVEGRRIDIRVVTLPLVHGEGAVLRVLDKGVVVQNLESLGMHRAEQERFDGAIHRPHGAVLVTGPTGSGKSTTLYAAVNVLNDGARSILTIEDPVESRIAGVKQMQVATKAGVTFETGLRSMLRADPDVIMVGEIRDRETAHIAVEAALTGHLVLSTLHTRDAPSALGRLTDMGIEPFLVSSAIDCIVAQRLVRMLCPHCKRPANLPGSVLEEYGLTGIQPYEPVGCSRCSASGYRGRVGIYEVLSITEEIRGQILQHASVDEIAATATRNGMRRLHDDGIEKVRAGLTSIEEVERMTTSLV
ncbi:MAG TPA: ATPase, T2SS/T4P/T4SS family [Solirubrobacteraceae bacterium]|jgi:type IV pilus assembly protein PilB